MQAASLFLSSLLTAPPPSSYTTIHPPLLPRRSSNARSKAFILRNNGIVHNFEVYISPSPHPSILEHQAKMQDAMYYLPLGAMRVCSVLSCGVVHGLLGRRAAVSCYIGAKSFGARGREPGEPRCYSLFARLGRRARHAPTPPRRILGCAALVLFALGFLLALGEHLRP